VVPPGGTLGRHLFTVIDAYFHSCKEVKIELNISEYSRSLALLPCVVLAGEW
jgi:hypothetical protein